MRAVLIAGLATPVLATSLIAQDSTYRAQRDIRPGRQLTAVYIGATACAPCVWPPFRESVRQLWSLLAAQADSAGIPFTTVGIAMDDDVQAGLTLLAPMTQWTEVLSGGGWTNHGVERYIWADTSGRPSIPQILVLERDVQMSPDGSQFNFKSARVLLRLTGADPIRQWVAAGARVTGIRGNSGPRVPHN